MARRTRQFATMIIVPRRMATAPRMRLQPTKIIGHRLNYRAQKRQKIQLSEKDENMPARAAQKKKTSASPGLSSLVLEKVPTGIRGLDQVTHGGFPKGRTALVCGGPGTGKTLLGTRIPGARRASL